MTIWRMLTHLYVRDVDKMFHSTRLETRTKESNMYASIWVVNPRCATKVKRCEFRNRVQLSADLFLGMDSSQSTHDGTRKMVNYA